MVVKKTEKPRVRRAKKVYSKDEPGYYKTKDFEVGDKVLYIVTYAGTKKDHPDNEEGVVDSIGKATVYVNFNGNTSGCKASRLIKV